MGDLRGIPPLGAEHTVCTLLPKAARARSIRVAFSERVEGLIEAASTTNVTKIPREQGGSIKSDLTNYDGVDAGDGQSPSPIPMPVR